MKIRQNKMMSYLAVTAGVGCVSSVANAAVVFYGNASNTNIQADPVGVSIGAYTNRFVVNNAQSSSGFAFNGSYFTQGSDISPFFTGSRGRYWRGDFGLIYGAVAGDQNYANITFNGNDGIYEAVAQFFFDGVGGGYLMAIATTNNIPNPQNLSAVGGPALSISAGKAMIGAAAIPEPSSLVLLALGATGLAARRQRKKAA